jgi:hypothetical protein
MFHICIMGGYEGVILPEPKVYFTLFGGCDFKRRTIARQILARRKQTTEGRQAPPKQFFLTICGGVEVKAPTLAEEFLDLRQLISSGELTVDDWDRAMSEISRSEVSISSFTLMGGLDETALPAENDEIESLAVQRHLGNISDSAGQVLQYGIGQRDSERFATIRRAALA